MEASSYVAKWSPIPTGQHFLKSAANRDITAFKCAQFSEKKAHRLFVKERWGGKKEFPCPRCGAIGRHYWIKSRLKWRCRFTECSSEFNVFTNTIFQDHKMNHRAILFGIVLFLTMSNGISMDHMANILGIQHKVAQVFIGKLREVIMRSQEIAKLTKNVHMDGGHFGGRPRHGRIRRVPVEEVQDHVVNKLMRKTKQPTKTAIANHVRRIKKRRLVFALTQISENQFEGGIRTIVAVADSENEEAAMSLALKHIEPGAAVMTDENPAYNQLGKFFDHHTVEHSKEFATIDGINSNQAECYYSRLRRHVIGVSHRIEPKYTLDTASEMAWRHDVRRMSQRKRLADLLKRINTSGLSRHWRGYFQGCNRPGEMIWSPEEGKNIIRKL